MRLILADTVQTCMWKDIGYYQTVHVCVRCQEQIIITAALYIILAIYMQLFTQNYPGQLSILMERPQEDATVPFQRHVCDQKKVENCTFKQRCCNMRVLFQVSWVRDLIIGKLINSILLK